MKKIIIGFVFAMFLLSLASASFEEGEIITQSQMDSFTRNQIRDLNLQCRYDDEGSLYWIFHNGDSQNARGWYYARWLSCLTLDPLPDGKYIVVRKSFTIHFKAMDYVGCLLTQTTVACNTRFNTNLLTMFNNEVLTIRQEILSRKTLTQSDFNNLPFIPTLSFGSV